MSGQEVSQGRGGLVLQAPQEQEGLELLAVAVQDISYLPESGQGGQVRSNKEQTQAGQAAILFCRRFKDT